MATFGEIKEVNEAMKKVPIKGKDYAMVNERVLAFRKLYPNGAITSDIIKLENGVVTVKATVMDEDGKILGTGLAQEKESNGFINATSFIENAETSAIGRALGFAGFGIDESIATADEVANAIINQQAKSEYISTKEQKVLTKMVEKKGYTVEEIFPKGLLLTGEQYTQAVKALEAMKQKGEE